MKDERRRPKIEKRDSERGYTLTELMIGFGVGNNERGERGKELGV